MTITLPKFRDFAPAAVILAAAGWFAYDRLGPGPAPPDPRVNAATLGKSYAPKLADACADGWESAAATLESGKTVAESLAAFKAAWSDSLRKAFASEVKPTFALVLPEGTEPADAAKRAEVVKLWRDFAAGLRKH